MNNESFLKNLFKKVLAFFGNHSRVAIISIISILLTAGGVAAYQINSKVELETVAIRRGDITEVVSVTGKVKPAESVELAFENGGKVTYLAGEEGKPVKAGQLLAVVSSGDVAADLEQAKASLRSEESKLAEMQNGAGGAELALQQAAVDRAELQKGQAIRALEDAIREAYSQADNAIRSKSYQFFNSPRSYNASLKLYVRYKSDSDEIELLRRESEEALSAWERKMTEPEFYREPDSFKQYLYTMQTFLDKLSMPVNALDDSSGYSSTQIDAYKADMFAARSSISNSLASLSSAISTFHNAESNLDIELRTLDLKKSGATIGEIATQQALVDRARASVSRYQAELSKKQIISPINGVLTKVELKKGEIVSPNQSVIFVMSDAEYEIEVYVPEADIEAVTVGDAATVTLDAYSSNDIFNARVSKIDPAETIIQGVSAYRAILQFEDKDNRIRSGMTANVEVASRTANNVLIVPSRAIHYSDESEYVELFIDEGVTKEVIVKAGLRNDDGETEVSGEIKENDLVVMP